MNMFEVKKINKIDEQDVKKLFTDADWTNYLNNVGKIKKGVKNSLSLYGAYMEDELVGFVRAVGDGETIVYIQDLIVLREHKRKGIGRSLIEAVLEEFSSVRQKVLITDNNSEATGFYKSIGFKDANSMGIVAFLKFDN